ncbi:lipocalin-like domain-containing protein [Streptomyces sp. NPDC058467]|uniref:lipocalin-like domain-containing protein n=1 Tax=unclassified Streptomyces TaxID=2593676 RepID=UPI00364ED1E7
MPQIASGKTPQAHNAGEGEPSTGDVTVTAPSRRRVLFSGLAVAAAAPLAGCTSVTAEDEASGQASGAALRASNDRLATSSAQALYTLPQDHKWHGGPFYDTGELEEWHYWTGYVTDKDTGEEFGLFYNLFHEGVSPGKYQYRPYFSLGNLKTHDFVWSANTLTSPLTATAPPQSTSPDDFQYSTSQNGTTFTTVYRASPDTWNLHFKSQAKNVNQPITMDLETKTQSSYGYTPMTPFGVENENAPWQGKADPQTMRSLSYYYGAPKQNVTGTVTIGNQTRHLTGSLWMEHQWGNFLVSKQPWGTAYVWSAIQFNDGSIFTFRQWYDQQNKPLLNIGRYMHATPNANPEYGFGEAVQWVPLQTWKSTASGRNYPVYARLSTPYGTWYYTPIFESYEMPTGYKPYGTNGITLYEGASWIRKDSLNGPIIGKAFLELPNSLTKNFPELSSQQPTPSGSS